MSDAWKEEFWKLYTSDEAEKFNSALLLKQKKIPRKLYHYRNVDNIDYTINEISTGEIYLSHPEKFNDHFDSTTLITSSDVSEYLHKDYYKTQLANAIPQNIHDDIFSSEDWHRKLMEYIRIDEPRITYEQICQLDMMLIKDVNKDFKDVIRSGIRVASLSETNCNNPMWYHYTKDYSGLCLEYDTANISEITRNIIFPVRYSDNYFDAIKLIRKKLLPRNISIYGLISACKHSDWSYEKEWRIIAPIYVLDSDKPTSRLDTNGRNYFFAKPTKVILGCKIHSNVEKAIIACCEENNIEYVKSEITEFGLKVD